MALSAVRMALCGSLLQRASLPTTPSNLSDQKPKWYSLCQQPKYITSFVVVLVLIFTLSSVQISFLDRIDSSFKISGQSKGLSVEGTDGCDLSANTSRKSVTELRSRSKGHVATAPCRQDGVNLPQGIIVATTDLQMRSLYPEDEKQVQNSMPNNLLAMAVGIKQKKVVNDIVQKFPLSNFTIMLFHYDGIVDQSSGSSVGWRILVWTF